jgi:hypothetical protein
MCALLKLSHHPPAFASPLLFCTPPGAADTLTQVLHSLRSCNLPHSHHRADSPRAAGQGKIASSEPCLRADCYPTLSLHSPLLPAPLSPPLPPANPSACRSCCAAVHSTALAAAARLSLPRFCCSSGTRDCARRRCSGVYASAHVGATSSLEDINYSEFMVLFSVRRWRLRHHEPDTQGSDPNVFSS